MNRRHEPRPAHEAALRDRLSKLSAASRRLNESLDFDTVLQGALDSACALTGARYGVLTLLDDGGRVQDFLASGLTAKEAARLWANPAGGRLFEALTGSDAPLRVPDLVGYVRSRGFAGFSIPLPVGVFRFLAAPLFHRGVRVGHLFVGRRGRRRGVQPGRRGHPGHVRRPGGAGDRQRPPAPGGAAGPGRPGDADRHLPGGRGGLRHADGRAPVLQPGGAADRGQPAGPRPAAGAAPGRADLPPGRRAGGLPAGVAAGRVAARGETLRAEEIVLRVPDGRSVTVLLNATPIRSAAGVVESMVVTMQDLAAVEELERLRAEFLAMVSHELRAPLTAIKGSAATVLDSPTDLDPAVVRQFFRLIGEQADHMHGLVSDLLDVARIETGTLAVTPEPAEVACWWTGPAVPSPAPGTGTAWPSTSPRTCP